MFTLRLMACMGAAGLVSEVLPLQRSLLAVVGLAGFEPATSATQTRRASQAALQPVPG